MAQVAREGALAMAKPVTVPRTGTTARPDSPVRTGPAGWNDGSDASVTFFEFTQAAWDDMMTRPWVSQITPTEAFPGDTLTVRGSRFTASDTVLLDGSPLATRVNADESLSVTLPLTLTGGAHQVFVRRADGIESNRVNVGIKPELDMFTDALAQGSAPTLKGRAFLTGASVLFNGSAIPANVSNPTTLTFAVPGTGGGGSVGGTVTVQVLNPDGRVSNLRTGQQPRILEVPFKYSQHNLSFGNFASANPGWGNYEDTFGAAEVWHEQFDPIFGHPFLTAAYFVFYVYFLKGKDNGGLATGFCTSLASLVADRFWLGKTDTPTVQLPDVVNQLTSVHGKLLSRQSLLTFHDQGREGIDRVERTYREIEATFLRGTDRQNQPLLFFIPSGEVWDSGYFDKLSDSHCVMPWRFVYPTDGRSAPQLTPDGASTISDPDGVELFVWDCNRPTGPASKLRFHRDGGKIHFEYIPDSRPTEFRSQDGITLGMMRHGDYMLADHDLPFGGPFGLTSFIIDFLLSPADLQVVDATGLRTGNFGGQLLAEIPDSHPCYLMKGHVPAARSDGDDPDDHRHRDRHVQLQLDHAGWHVDSPAGRRNAGGSPGRRGDQRRCNPDPVYAGGRQDLLADGRTGDQQPGAGLGDLGSGWRAGQRRRHHAVARVERLARWQSRRNEEPDAEGGLGRQGRTSRQPQPANGRSP